MAGRLHKQGKESTLKNIFFSDGILLTSPDIADALSMHGWPSTQEGHKDSTLLRITHAFVTAFVEHDVQSKQVNLPAQQQGSHANHRHQKASADAN